jgi:hypothetical protein
VKSTIILDVREGEGEGEELRMKEEIGERRIRTSEGISRLIYSQVHLTTLLSLLTN